MIDFYYWPTPNGWKVSILLEELQIPYKMRPINIGQGDQFTPEFFIVRPNNRMPAIVDHDVNGDTISVFESGAILWYLAEKTQRFIPECLLEKKEVLEWLFWQTGNQGPMGGQLSHFVNYAQGEHSYSHQRYLNEYDRCLGVLDRQLATQPYIVGDSYSIADIINWPWVLIAKPLGASLDEYPNLNGWRSRIKERPAVMRGVDLGKDLRRKGPPSDDERKILFNQTGNPPSKS